MYEDINKNYIPKNIKTTPASNLYKLKKGNGEGSALKTFGKYIGEGVTYFFESASSSKVTAKEKPSVNTSSISIADNSL